MLPRPIHTYQLAYSTYLVGTVQYLHIHGGFRGHESHKSVTRLEGLTGQAEI